MCTNKNKNIKTLIIIGGPTASGKTALSIEIASHFDAEIFSADSRQVYKELNIGVAKPSAEQLSAIQHHFIGNTSIHDDYNVGLYEKECFEKLSNYFENKDIAVMVGGTGLYISAVINGLDEFPDVDEKVKNDIANEFKENGLTWLQSELRSLDPEYYEEVDIYNYSRILRALEVIKSSGKKFSSLRIKTKRQNNFNVVGILPIIQRDELYTKINNRVDLMLSQGLREEAKELFTFSHIKALQTVGYQELFKSFSNEITDQEAVELIKQNSRRYAKRQITWFKKYNEWQSFDYQSIDTIFSYLEKLFSQN